MSILKARPGIVNIVNACIVSFRWYFILCISEMDMKIIDLEGNVEKQLLQNMQYYKKAMTKRKILLTLTDLC